MLIYTIMQLDLCHCLYIWLCPHAYLLCVHGCPSIFPLYHSVLPCYPCWSSLFLPWYMTMYRWICVVLFLISIHYILTYAIYTITSHSHYPLVMSICAHIWLLIRPSAHCLKQAQSLFHYSYYTDVNQLLYCYFDHNNLLSLL